MLGRIIASENVLFLIQIICEYVMLVNRELRLQMESTNLVMGNYCGSLGGSNGITKVLKVEERGRRVCVTVL